MVKLDENTVSNAVEDGHFAHKEDSPRYAVSMGAQLVYRAQQIILLANGSRKASPVAESLLQDPSPMVPISYGQIFSKKGGKMIYVIDRDAAGHLYGKIDELKQRGIEVEDISDGHASQRVEDLNFFRDSHLCLMG